MGRRVDDDQARANGFCSPLSQPVDVHRAVSSAGAAAALVLPVLGVAYGIIRVGYEQYYAALGLSPEVVGLGQAAIVSGVAVLVGTLAALLATWIMFGVVVYRLLVPLRTHREDSQRSLRDWLRLSLAYIAGFCVALSPGLFAALVGGGYGFTLWASGAVIFGLLALEASWMLGDSELRLAELLKRAARSAYDGSLPQVRLLASLAVAGGVTLALVFNFLNDATHAGRVVRATGRLEMGYLAVTVSPARIVPKGDDPLRVCDGLRKAVLVGRNGSVSYVLMFLPGDAAGSRSEVVPLQDGDYAVATATNEPQSCNPKLP